MINLMCSEGSHSCGSGGFLWQREENITVICSGPREEHARFAHMDTIHNHSPSLLELCSNVEALYYNRTPCSTLMRNTNTTNRKTITTGDRKRYDYRARSRGSHEESGASPNLEISRGALMVWGSVGIMFLRNMIYPQVRRSCVLALERYAELAVLPVNLGTLDGTLVLLC